jgi:hypothetical protein
MIGFDEIARFYREVRPETIEQRIRACRSGRFAALPDIKINAIKAPLTEISKVWDCPIPPRLDCRH